MWKNSHSFGSSAHARTSRSVKYLEYHTHCYVQPHVLQDTALLLSEIKMPGKLGLTNVDAKTKLDELKIKSLVSKKWLLAIFGI